MVDPPEYINNPQLHLSQLRIKDNYEVRNRAGKVLKGSRKL